MNSVRIQTQLVSLLAACALALACVESRTAIVVDATVTLPSESASPLKYRFWLQDAKLREEGFSGDIALLLDDKLVLLDSHERNYQVIDRAMIERLSFDPERLKQKLATESANLLDARRAWLEKKLKRLDASSPAESAADSVRDTGRTESLEGRNYEVWERQRDGHLSVQYLVTPVGVLPEATEWQRVLETLARLTTGINLPAELKEHAPDPLGILGRAKDMIAMQAPPIIIREFARDGTLRVQSRLRLRESSPVPDSYFAVPEGFHLVALTERAPWVSK